MHLASEAAKIAEACLPDEAAALRQHVANAETNLADAEADLDVYETIGSALRDGLSRLSDRAVGSACQQQLERLILTRSEAILMQSRQWCAPFGFELKLEELPAPAWRD